MITNERQYKISRRQREKLRQATAEFDTQAKAEQTGSMKLATASLQALESEVEVLSSEISEYESLRSGAIVDFSVSSLDELPRMLIRARIARGLTQRELAELVELKEQQVQRYEATEYSSANLRRLMKIAAALELDVCQTGEPVRSSDAGAPTESGELDWSRFPVREMYRRHWFEGFKGTLDAAVRESDTLVKEYVLSVIRTPAAALHRKHVRAGSTLDEYALLAWECRLLSLASRVDLPAAFGGQPIDLDWLREFAKLSSHADGPLRARDALREVGIALVV